MTISSIAKLSFLATDSLTKIERVWRAIWKVLVFSPVDEALLPKKGLCISIEKDDFHIISGTSFLSRLSINGYKKYAFESRQNQPEFIASSVALFLDEFRIGKTDVTLTIPRDWFIIRTVELPSSVRENLANVVLYELDRLTPFSPENAIYDFRILKEANGKLSILLAVAKADMVNPYIEALKEKGIKVRSVVPNLACIGTFTRYITRKADFLFFDIGNNEYEGALFTNGTISEAFKGRFYAEDEKSKSDAIAEAVSSVVTNLKKSGRDHVVLLSFRDTNPVLREMVRLKMNIPFKIMDEMDLKISNKKGMSYSAIGGLLESLWTKAEVPNLLRRGLRETIKPPMLLTVFLTLLIVAMGVVYIVAPLYVEEKRLKEIEDQIAIRKEEVKKVEALKRDVDAINEDILTVRGFKEGRLSALDIMKELTSVVPKSAWLTRVRVTATTVDIEGYAASASELISKIEASKYFRKVEFASPTFRDVRMNADRFSIRMEIESTKTELINTKTGTDENEEE